MKILQIIPHFGFGGAETMCENLTYAQLKLGHEVTVVSLYAQRTAVSQRMERAGVRLLYLDKKPGLDITMVPKLRNIMKKERPDVVHTHLDVIKYAVAAAKLAGVKTCVHTVHNVAEKEAEGRVQKLINGTYFRLGWSVPVALSPEVRTSIAAFYGRDMEQIPMAYNGIDLSRCRPKTDYSLGQTVNLLHIGRFNQQKNHKMLLPMFAKLYEEDPRCRLWLLGDGELRPETEKLAQDLGISEAVRFCGAQSNVYPYLHDADIFLLPSLYEGMPMAIIEAMGTALPIVATEVGGVPDMLENGVSGMLTPCEEEALRSACRKLIESEELRARMGQNALRGSRRFSAEHMAEQYCRIYQNS